MALKVEFRAVEDGQDVLVGSITWTGKEFVCTPNLRILQQLVEDPVRVRGREGLEDLYSGEEPETWMQNLYREYHGVGFRATKAESV